MNQFNPTIQSLKDSERLCIKHGKLMVEDKSIRNRTNWLSRLFSRGQYSHAATLKKMQSVYRENVKEHTSTSEAFILNYDNLIKRAETHNRRYEKSCFAFLFKVDIKAHKSNLVEMKANLPPIQNPHPQEPSNAWWGEGTPDEDVIQMSEFGALGCPYAANLLNLINPKFNTINVSESSYVLLELLEAIGLVTVQDFMDKGLTNREKFNAYLAKNSESLTMLIKQKNPTIIQE